MSYVVKLTNVNNMAMVSYITAVSDGIIENTQVRYFITETGVRHEVPMTQFLVEFSSDRMKLLDVQK